MLRDVSALANADGGELIIGIAEYGEGIGDRHCACANAETERRD